MEKVEVERSKVEQSIAKQQQEATRLDKEEEKYWLQYNEYQKQLLEFEEEQQRFVNSKSLVGKRSMPVPYCLEISLVFSIQNVCSTLLVFNSIAQSRNMNVYFYFPVWTINFIMPKCNWINSRKPIYSTLHLISGKT